MSLIIKKTYSISDTTSLADVNINENITFSDVSSTATSDYAKSGNGYARITFIGESIN